MTRTVTRDIGGSALSRAAIAGKLPEWYAVTRGPAEWTAASREAAERFQSRSWLDTLLPAFSPEGAAADRLEAAATRGGIVVTGGQQPGLFGGPLYVLYKAISLVEMARALEAVTSLPVAPVFWAATDDTDFVEASHVSVVNEGRLEKLAMMEPAERGRSMASTPLGDVSGLFDKLTAACGKSVDEGYLRTVRGAYGSDTSVGSAYVSLLRSLLHPLGVAVLDAAHPAVREAGKPTLLSALERATAIAAGLQQRSDAIAASGFRPQVAHVPNLSLVFETLDDGTRRRIPLRDADRSRSIPANRLGPNVLLRPLMERQILPTVTYVGGPGEIAYFAQVSAVADVLGMTTPRILPRWSGTFIEPDVADAMTRLGATIQDFGDPHAIEGRLAREAISPAVRRAMDEVRNSVSTASDAMRGDAGTTDALRRSIGAMQAGVEYRLTRLERRYAAAVKQAGTDRLRDVAHVRASVYPDGAPQERVLSFVPFLARHGAEFVASISAAAREHADRMITSG